MPSKDSTGKRLAGGAQRRQAAAHRAQRAALAAVAPDLVLALPEFGGAAPAPASTPLDGIPLPPGTGRVEDLVAWAVGVQARAACLAAAGQDAGRVRACSVVVGAMGKLRSCAGVSADLVQLLRNIRRQDVDVHSEQPPTETSALCAWAFHQLARLLHRAATWPELDEALISHTARAFASVGSVVPEAQMRTLLAELTAEAT